MASESRGNNLLLVHGALLLTQFCWGSAAVVNKLALSGAGIYPLLFALLREVTAAPLLVVMLVCARRWQRSHEDESEVCSDPVECGVEASSLEPAAPSIALRVLPGVFIFIDQLCSLCGVALSDPFSAAAWQPSQVVFTMVISSLLGLELLTVRKTLAALLTVAGAISLVVLDDNPGPNDGGVSPRVGQLFFFLNCLASSLEVIVWRRLLKHASGPSAHIAVMAESYLVAACLMVCACIATSFSSDAVDFFCPQCQGNAWHFQPEALWAVGYSVIIQTLVGYVAQAWALRVADASLASLYATAQPIMAAALVCLLLISSINPHDALRWPGKEMFGAVLIIAGLFVYAGHASQSSPSLARERADCESAKAASVGSVVPVVEP